MKTYRIAAMTVAILVVIQHPAAAEQLGPITLVVQREGGEPIADAQVHCVNWEYETLRTTPLQDNEKGITDSNGQVTFQDKTIGQVFVQVIAGAQGGWYRVHDGGDHPVVTLTAGTGHTLRGSVRTPGGEPMEGVRILADGCLPAGKTDAAGRFAIPNAGVPYSPELVFVEEGYAPFETRVHFDANEVKIALKPSVKVPVKVVYPDGTPAANAGVSGGPRWNWGLKTDDQGLATIPHMPVGEESGLNASARRDEIVYQVHQRFTVPPASPDRITLTLEAVHYVDVKGKLVHAETGEPVVGRVFMDNSPEFYSPRERTHTGEDGKFAFEDVWPGHYWLFAAPTTPTLYQVGGPQQVHLPEDTGEVVVEVSIDEGCAIRGTVMTADGKPVEKQQVMWQPMPHYRAIWTDGAGHFVIPHLDGVGLTYTVEVSDEYQRVVKANIGPMEKGQIVSGVELRLPAAMKPAVLRGTVTDPSGEPLPNVRLSFLYDEGIEPRSISATTNESGNYELEIVNSGVVELSASRGVQIEQGRRSDNLSVACRILGPDRIELSANRDRELALVVQPEELQMLAGRVTDPQGRAIEGCDVRLLFGEHGSDGISMGGQAEFQTRNLPEEPFVMEVTAQGYKARALPEADVAAARSGGLNVILEPGPFAIGESVWATVTGTPPTPESVARFPLAERIRKNEWHYYQRAQPPKPQDPAAAARTQSYQKQLRVLDADGNPVKRIYLEPLHSLPVPEQRLYASESNRQLQSLVGADGTYQLPLGSYGAIVYTADSGRVLVKPEWSNQPAETTDVVLQEAASLELRIQGADKNAAAGVPIYIGKMAWDHEANAQAFQIGETGPDGAFRLDRLAPGFHGFAVGAMGRSMRMVTVQLQPGEARVEAFDVSVDPHADPQIQLQHWREALRDRVRREGVTETLQEKVDALSAKERRQLERAVLDGIAVLPDTIGWRGWEANEMQLYAALVIVLKDEDAVPLLQDHLAGLQSGEDRGTFWGRPETAGAIANAIVALEGDDSTEYFAGLAGDPAADRAVRLAALLALGEIGSKGSAEAFARLRDAAYGSPNAPERKEAYTHAERMTESAHMVLWVLSGNGGMAPRPFNADAYSGATVSEDYTSGSLNTTTFGGWTDLQFRRVGDEWLLTQIGGTLVV